MGDAGEWSVSYRIKKDTANATYVFKSLALQLGRERDMRLERCRAVQNCNNHAPVAPPEKRLAEMWGESQEEGKVIPLGQIKML